MFGFCWDTVNGLEVVDEPWRDATVILPDVAPTGTPATIVLAVFCEKGASTPLNITDVVALNPLPEIVTVVATGPWVGAKDVMCGAGGAAPAEERPSSESDSAPTSAMPTRWPRGLGEDRTGADLLEGRESVCALVDAEVHGHALEVGERVRVDHRLDPARRSAPGLDRVARLEDPFGLRLRAGAAADVAPDRAPLLDHHALADGDRVLVRGVEHVRERLPEVVARAGAAVVAVHADQVAPGGDPRARPAVRPVVRDA